MDISRRNVMLTAALAVSAATLARTSVAQTMGDEMREHPRIITAIREMEDAIRYMEAAPHDFGGFKARAIEDTRRAIDSLRMALHFREHRDREREYERR
jgi:hypothetical protein